MKKYNFHTHTYRCGHAEKNITDEAIVKTFIDNGFEVVAFTDHCPEKEMIDRRKNMRMDYSMKDDYLASINDLKEKYKDKIRIESGYEVEYLPGQEDNLLELKAETDKIVLGQHFIYDDDGRTLKIFRHDEITDSDLFRYAEYIVTAMQKGIPDIIVHPDLYMISRKDFGMVESQVAHIICKAAEKYNIPLEINLTEPLLYSIGLKNNISYPNRNFWEIASNYHVKVLYGLDVHYLESIERYESSICLARKVIGEDIIDKLDFINID